MARSLAPERLPVDVVAELDEEDRLVYKRLLVADEAEALHRFHVYVAAHQKRDHRPNADRKSIDARVGASPWGEGKIYRR